MRKEILIYIFILLAVNSNVLLAQDIKKDLAAMRKIYKDAQRLSMNIEYTVHLDNNFTVPYEKETALYKRNGELFYLKQMETEIIRNARYVTIVNHERKLVMIDKAKKTEMAPWEIPLDSLMPLYKDAKYYIPENRPELKAYTLTFSTGLYKSVDVWFNGKTFLIEKIQMQYRDKVEENKKLHDVTMVMKFNNVNTNPQFSLSTFSEGIYLQEMEGKYSLKPAYRNYTLVNHLNEKK